MTTGFLVMAGLVILGIAAADFPLRGQGHSQHPHWHC